MEANDHGKYLFQMQSSTHLLNDESTVKGMLIGVSQISMLVLLNSPKRFRNHMPSHFLKEQAPHFYTIAEAFMLNLLLTLVPNKTCRTFKPNIKLEIYFSYGLK